jgi:hypothetical protein
MLSQSFAFLHQLAARPRLVCAGITAICFHGIHDPDKPDEEQLGIITLWHALVALTSGTDIRLRLRSEPAAWRSSPTGCMRLLSAPSRTELVQRLTALDICVSEDDNVAVVYSLAALRHLRLWSAVKNTALQMFYHSAWSRAAALPALRAAHPAAARHMARGLLHPRRGRQPAAAALSVPV